MIKHIWHTGKPPSIGWWFTQYKNDDRLTCMRWWDGVCWSVGADTESSAEEAEGAASSKTWLDPLNIKWCARWWE